MSKDDLKSKFTTGSVPSQSDYEALINTIQDIDDISFSLHPYFAGVTSNSYYDTISETRYYITVVPSKDAGGRIIPLRQAISNPESPTNWELTGQAMTEKHPNFNVLINASPVTTGVSIVDGVEVLPPTDNADKYCDILCIDNKNMLSWAPSNTPSSDLISKGITQAISGYFLVKENGVTVDWRARLDKIDVDNRKYLEKRHPRQVISQKDDGTIIILTCDGRRVGNKGMTIEDIDRILTQLNCTFIWNLDGGGSTTLYYRGTRFNETIDSGFTSERKIMNWLYIKSTNSIFTDLTNALQGYNKRLQNLSTLVTSITSNSTDTVKLDVLPPYLETSSVAYRVSNKILTISGRVTNIATNDLNISSTAPIAQITLDTGVIDSPTTTSNVTLIANGGAYGQHVQISLVKNTEKENTYDLAFYNKGKDPVKDIIAFDFEISAIIK